jgi:hypothetical protein
LFVFLGKFLVGFYLNLKLVLEGFYFLVLGSDCRFILINQWSDHVTVEYLELELLGFRGIKCAWLKVLVVL